MDMSNMLDPSAAAFNRDGAKAESLRMMALNDNGKMSEHRMREAAEEFEGMLIRQLLKEMRKTVPKSELSDQSFSTEMYTDIADDYLAKELAASNSFGISDIIYEELKEKNDRIKDPSEKKGNPFMPLKGKNGGNSENEFIPLLPTTNDFIKLQKNPQMIELERDRDEFMRLGRHSRISTDKIQSP